MAKGHLCPLCETHTLQPESTNYLRCSSCKTKFHRDQIPGA